MKVEDINLGGVIFRGKVLIFREKMPNILLNNLSIEEIWTISIPVDHVMETIERGFSIRTGSLAVRKKSYEDLLLNGGCNKQARVPES